MLVEIKKIIEKYNFPPEYVGKIECLSCDVYDFIEKNLRERILKEKIKENNILKCEKVSDVVERNDKLRDPISMMIKDAMVGEKIFVKESDFNGVRSKFAMSIHPRVSIHSKITTQYNYNLCGWVITKIKDLTK